VTTRILRYAQVVFLLAGVVLAILWVRHPDKHYDAWLGLSVATIPILELVKRKLDEPREKGVQEGIVTGALQKVLNDFEAAKRRGAEQEKSRAAQEAKERERPTTDLRVEKYTAVVTFRTDLESRMQELAKLRGIDPIGKTVSELLASLSMPESWKKGIAGFLKLTDNLAHEPEAMVDWAVTSGPVYIGVLNTLIEGKKPISQKQ